MSDPRILKHTDWEAKVILGNIKLLEIELKKNKTFFEDPWLFSEEIESDIILRISELKKISNLIIDMVNRNK